MKHCEDFLLLASLAVDGEASESERQELAAHLSACPDCLRFYEDLRNIHEACIGEDAAAPADFAASVMAQVRETPQDLPIQRKTVSFSRRRWLPAALAACFCVAALGAGRLLGGDAIRCVSQSIIANSASDTAAPTEAAPKAGKGLHGSAPPSGAPSVPEEKVAAAGSASRPERAQKAADDAAPAPALAAPQAMNDAAPEAAQLEDAEAKTTERTVMVTIVSPVAGAWVEEHLGLDWTGGESYELTLEEYAALRAALGEAGEEFTEELDGGAAGPYAE